MADLEKIEVLFSAQFGELNKSIDTIKKQLGDIAETSGRTARETTASFQAVSRASDTVTKSLTFARDAAIALSVAFTGMKLADAVRDAAMSAARFETMGVVLNSLATNTKYSAVEIQQFAAGVQNMGITMNSSREVVARMIQGNINLSQSTRLARVAQDAAVIGNVNSSEALQRLIYGIQSAQIEVLRTIGINVNFEASYARMAAQLGKSADSLSELEKAQARTNAVMEAGANIAGAYDAAMDTAGKQILSMQRYVENISTQIGNVFLPALTSVVFQVVNGMKAVDNALSSARGRQSIEAMGAALKAVADQISTAFTAISVGMAAVAGIALVRFVMSLGVVSAATTAIGAAFAGWPLAIGAALAGLTYFLIKLGRGDEDLDRIETAIRKQEAATRSLTGATEDEISKQRELTEERLRAATAAKKSEIAALEASAVRVREQMQGALGGIALPQGWRGYGGRALTQVTPEILTGPASSQGRIAIEQMKQAVREFYATTAEGRDGLEPLLLRLKELKEATGGAGGAIDTAAGELIRLIEVALRAPGAIQAAKDKLAAFKAELGTPGTGFQVSTFETEITTNLRALGLVGGVGGREISVDGITRAKDAFQVIVDTIARGREQIDVLKKQMADLSPSSEDWRRKSAEVERITASIEATLRGMPLLISQVARATETEFAKAWREVAEQLEMAGVQNPVSRARISARYRADEMIADRARYPALMLDEFTLETDQQRAARLRNLAEQRVTVASREQGAALGEATRQAQIRAEWAAKIALAEYDGAAAVRAAQAQMELLLEASKANGNVAAATAAASERQAAAIAQAVTQARILQRDSQGGLDLMIGQLQGTSAGAAVAREQARQAAIRSVGADQVDAIAEIMRGFDSSKVREAADAMARIGLNAQSSLVSTQAELRTLGLTASERERITSIMLLQQQYQQDIIGATESERAGLEQIYNLSVQRVNALAAAKANVEAAARTMDALKEAGDAVGQAFTQAIINGRNLNDVLNNLLNTLLQIFAKQFILAPLQQVFSGFMGNLLGGGGAAGGFGNGAGLLDVGSFPGVTLGSGGVMAGPGISAFSNGIVNRPTVFPFAKGIGLMGEAGAEAIFPLFRTPSGDLGVRAGGGMGGGDNNVVVNVYAPPGSNVTQERRSRGGEQEIDIFIDKAVAQNISRPGSRSYRAMRETWGGQQQMVAR